MDGMVRTCCPLCGGEIIVSEYYQKSYDHKVLKNGKMSKRYTVTDAGFMSARTAACGNLCGAYWEEDDFDIAEDGTFYDKKYTKMEDDT